MNEYLIRQTAYRRQLTDRERPVLSAINAVSLATEQPWEEVYRLMLEQAEKDGMMPHHLPNAHNLLRAAGYASVPVPKQIWTYRRLDEHLRTAYPGITSAVVCSERSRMILRYQAMRPVTAEDGRTHFAVHDTVDLDHREVKELWIPAREAGLAEEPFQASRCAKARPWREHHYYRYFQPNPRGNSIGDCVIRAYAGVFQVSWGEAAGMLARACEYTTVQLNAGNFYQYLASEQQLIHHPALKKGRRLYTVEELCRWLTGRYKNGERFFINVGEHHVAAVIPVPDEEWGSRYVVADSWDCSGRPTGDFWEYHPPVEAPAKPEPVRPPEDPAELSLIPGSRVIHPAFGEGQVTGVEGAGRSCRITLLFDSGEEKTLGEMWVRTHCAQGA